MHLSLLSNTWSSIIKEKYIAMIRIIILTEISLEMEGIKLAKNFTLRFFPMDILMNFSRILY
ncbi:hypothetical protein MTP04_33200 [Lysinibacillus sp. PLM2]|nr:hypothetical protein MTP04_33200 [Lysinibacillus sp. PLM2]